MATAALDSQPEMRTAWENRQWLQDLGSQPTDVPQFESMHVSS